MYNFRSFLQDLSQSTGVNFSLTSEDGTAFYDGGYKFNNFGKFEFHVMLGKQKAKVVVDDKYEICTSLLKYAIENKYKELFSMREQCLIDILEGKEVGIDKLDKNFPFLSKGCTLFLVSVDGSRYEALNIIKQLYNDQDVISMIYGDNLVVMGNYDEVSEHAESIRESIISDLYCRCYVSFGAAAFSGEDIKKAYEVSKECMVLGKKYDIKGEIYDYTKMLFEKIVYSVDPRVKKDLMDSFKEKFNLFDSEMINTIEEFVNSGLNISDASRKLYIHRNTLIYRLDKIDKDMGYDIRDFKQATVFIIAFLVWKENR